MARNNKNNDSDINKLNDKININLYGVSQEFLDKNNDDINQIKNVIERITVKNNYVTGENPIEFLTKMAYNDKQNNVKSALESLPKDRNGNINLNRFMNGMNLSQVNEIYAEELDRISGYDDYRAITRYIPQISQGINIWKDNIISPDDFTKDIFNIIYDDSLNQELREKVEKNIEGINEKYKIEDKVDEWIKNTLICGDEFIAVLKLDDEFNTIFDKTVSEDCKILDESINLSEDNLLISENEINELKNIYLEKKNDKELNNEKFTASIKSELSEIINNNIKFTSSPLSLIEEELPIIKSMRDEVDKNNKYANIKNNIAKEFDLSSDGTIGKKKNTELDKFFINGSYIKTLEPDRVVKVKIAETVYGYFYIEVKGKNELIHPKNVYSALTLRQTVDLTSSDTSWVADPKIRLITDLFARNISKKIDKEFIADNKEFKNIIYELLKNDYIYNNNIQITFFDPNTIKHLMVAEGKDGYGISILKDIVFTAKLYLSVLITTLLTKISRSQEHRTFYIETGLSDQVEEVVNSFIRETKSKEVKVADTQSIDSIFSTIGSCSTFYIPVVNGERAVEIDTTPGLNVDMDNDLLEYLRQTMISGMGIPSSMLNYTSEVEFARTLSMQNGIFLRAVITKQKKLTPPFSSMYRDLYQSEYGNSVISLVSSKENENNRKEKIKNNQEINGKFIGNNKDEDKSDKDFVNIDLIKVQFPSPSSLNATNISEQINTGSSIVQAIAEAMFDANDQNTDNQHKFKFIQELNRMYIPNIDWKNIEELYEKSKFEAINDSINASIKSKGNEETM